MLDDLAGALIGALIGDAIEEGIVQGRAKRKARRFLAGEPIVFRAFLRRADERVRRSRLRVTPGTEQATWTPWPRRGRSSIAVVLLGERGNRDELRRHLGGVPMYGWTVRVDEDHAETLLLEGRYLAAFAPIISLGSVAPPALSAGRSAGKRRRRRWWRR